MIYIESKRRKRENIEKQYPNAIIWDITSTSENEEARKLSPFYPHGGVHIPSFSGMTATCVEAVWQGLKVFENSDIDVETFKNDTMKGLKRTVRRFGPIRGHRKGEKLLNYIEARKQIYIPTYEWVLKNVPACDTGDLVLLMSVFVL